MLKKTVTYTDYNGVEREEDLYFNLNQSELLEMEASVDGGMSAMLEKIVAEQNPKKIMEFFKDFLLKAYGQKSADGRRFIKSDELREEFSQTEAYNKIFTELAFDANAAAAFVNGVMPKETKATEPVAFKA